MSAAGDFIRHVSAPLAIGTVQLADGSNVHGFVCEPIDVAGAADITQFGGWRTFHATGSASHAILER